MLFDNLGLESAFSVSGDINRNLTMVTFDDLRTGPVTGVSPYLSMCGIFLVAKVVGDLTFQGSL